MFYDRYRDFFPYMDPMDYSSLKEISASVFFVRPGPIVLVVFCHRNPIKIHLVTLGPPRLRFPQHVQLVFGWVDSFPDSSRVDLCHACHGATFMSFWG